MMTQRLTKGESTRVRILSATMTLINTRGYHATTLRDIIQATGVQKGNLYFHFSGKESLVLALIDWAWGEYTSYLMAKAGGGPYGDRLGRLIDAVVCFHRDNGLSGGCLFGNLAMETADTVPPVAEAVSRILDQGHQKITSWITKGMADGSMYPGPSPESASHRLIAGLEGGILMARLKQDLQILETCAMGLKQALLPETSQHEINI